MRNLEIKNIEIESIEGKQLTLSSETTIYISKQVGNAVYNQARSIEMRRIAKDIHDEKIIELTPQQAAEIKAVVLDPNQCNLSGLLAFSIGEYLDTIINDKSE